MKYAVDWTFESDGVSRAATAAAAPGSKWRDADDTKSARTETFWAGIADSERRGRRCRRSRRSQNGRHGSCAGRAKRRERVIVEFTSSTRQQHMRRRAPCLDESRTTLIDE